MHYELAKKITNGDWNLSDDEIDTFRGARSVELLKRSMDNGISVPMIEKLLMNDQFAAHPVANEVMTLLIKEVMTLLIKNGRGKDAISLIETFEQGIGEDHTHSQALEALLRRTLRDGLYSDDMKTASSAVSKLKDRFGPESVDRSLLRYDPVLRKLAETGNAKALDWALDQVTPRDKPYVFQSQLGRAYARGIESFPEDARRGEQGNHGYPQRPPFGHSGKPQYTPLSDEVKAVLEKHFERDIKSLPKLDDSKRDEHAMLLERESRYPRVNAGREADMIAREVGRALERQSANLNAALQAGDYSAFERGIDDDEAVRNAIKRAQKSYFAEAATAKLEDEIRSGRPLDDGTRNLLRFVTKERGAHTLERALESAMRAGSPQLVNDIVGEFVATQGKKTAAKMFDPEQHGRMHGLKHLPYSMADAVVDAVREHLGDDSANKLTHSLLESNLARLAQPQTARNGLVPWDQFYGQARDNRDHASANDWALQMVLKLPPEERKKLDLPPLWKEKLDAGLPKHELWQELGAGEKRWQEVFSKEPPHPRLKEESPFKFSQKVYDALLPTLECVASLERGWTGNAVSYAYKLAVLFPSVQEADRFLTSASAKAENGGSEKPVADALNFQLPKSGVWDVNAWKTLVLQHGTKVTKFIEFAPKIEAELRATEQPFPRTPTALTEIAAKLCYERGRENPEFALLAFNHNLKESNFNKALDVLASPDLKTRDNLPDIRIDGAEIGHDKYYMEKLPVGDPRGLLLGKITNCCQSIGGAGEKCALHGMTSENAGFYVWKHKTDGKITANDPIIAQSWAWIGKEGELVFDSFERLGKAYNPLAQPFIETFAARVQDKFKEVRLGMSGDTPRMETLEQARPAAVPLDYNDYRDSKSQYVIEAKEHGHSRPAAAEQVDASWANRTGKSVDRVAAELGR